MGQQCFSLKKKYIYLLCFSQPMGNGRHLKLYIWENSFQRDEKETDITFFNTTARDRFEFPYIFRVLLLLFTVVDDTKKKEQQLPFDIKKSQKLQKWVADG